MARRALTTFLLAWVAFSPVVAAEKEKPLPKDLPPYSELKPFHPPSVAPRRLANGQTVWLVPRPGFPKVSLAIAVRGGKAADPKDRPGLATLLTSTVDQGTRTRSAKQIAEELQAAGGDLSGDPGADDILLFTSVLASKLEAGLTVLSDVLQNATFPDDEVDLAKRNAADRLKSDEAEPTFLARRALAKAVFGDHPYSVFSPTQDSIAATTAPELRREYARRFRPDQTVVVAVGDFEGDKLMASVESLLGKWAAPAEPAVPTPPRPTSATPHAAFMVPRPESVQTTVALGSIAPTRGEADYPAAQVANAIYGGMFGSRLTLNIREDKGYTYSPFALLSPRRRAAVFQSWAAVRNEVTGATLNEICYELNRMATTAPRDEEVTHAQRYLIGTRALELQAQDALAQDLARLWVFGLPPEELGAESEKVAKVTAKDVEEAGAKYFPAASQAIVAVGDEKVIQKQLAVFGLAISPLTSR